TTDTPVWWLVGATFGLVLVTLGLVVVTSILAYAAWGALGELETTVQQLEESKRDRHVSVFLEFGQRWGEQPISDALLKENRYGKLGLARLVETADQDPGLNPWRRRAKRRANDELAILL